MDGSRGQPPHVRLAALDAALERLPRHLWDECLWEFGQQLVAAASEQRQAHDEAAPALREVHSAPA